LSDIANHGLKQYYLVYTQRISINGGTNLFSPPSGPLAESTNNGKVCSSIQSCGSWQLCQQMRGGYLHLQGDDMVVDVLRMLVVVLLSSLGCEERPEKKLLQIICMRRAIRLAVDLPQLPDVKEAPL
jgi:hypothetical protein